MDSRFSVALLASVVLAACGGGGGSVTPPPPPPPPPLSAPVFTSPGFITIAENTVDTGYTASATDNDSTVLTFAVNGGSDQSSFHIDSTSGVLTFVGSTDFENAGDANADNTYVVELSVRDNDSNTNLLTVNVTVVDANDAPVFSSDVEEDVRQDAAGAAYTAIASDDDGDVITFSVTGGVDASLFVIDTTTGEMNFSSPPDFNNPLDVDADNTYVVELAADDGNNGLAALRLELTVIGSISVEVFYPTANAEVGGSATSILVTGRVLDFDDGTVSNTDVSDVSVNGLAASIASTDPFIWSARIPVQSGENGLTVAANSMGTIAGRKEQFVTRSFSMEAPSGIAYDSGTQLAVVADAQAAAIFSVDLVTGVRTLIANNSPGVMPVFSLPAAVAIDTADSRILVVDEGRSALLAVTLSGGAVSVVSDSTNMDTAFDNPRGLTLDTANDRALVLDVGIAALLGVDLATGNRTIVSGAGTGTGTNFSFPNAVVLNSAGNRAFVVDIDLKSLISVDLSNGNRTIVSGGGTGTGTELDRPSKLTLDTVDNRMLVLDEGLDALISIDLASGDRVAIADRNSLDSLITQVTDVQWAEDSNDALILNTLPSRVLAVGLDTGAHSLVSGARVGNGDSLVNPTAVALDLGRNRALIADTGLGVLVSVDLDNASRSPVPNSGSISSYSALLFDAANDRALVLDSGDNGTLYSLDFTNDQRRTLSGMTVGSGPTMSNPKGIALDPGDPNTAYVVDIVTDALLSIDLRNGDRVEVSGSNTGSGPILTDPIGVAIDPTNNRALVVDLFSRCLFSVDLTSGARAIISGNGVGSGNDLLVPQSLSVNLVSNLAYVTDLNGFVIAIDLATGDRADVASESTGSGPGLASPVGITVDVDGNRAFLVDNGLRALLLMELDSLERAIASQ